ncbi:hypothetical protein J2P12_01355 [Candidatus Bathyarchaeota archaeon]|nr:hypothetical protein [Candidatus Bathyarchaeota archaeon]
MESEPEPSPRARHRFGFSGKTKRSRVPEHTALTSDDILESLTRQAASQVGFREEQTESLELLEETGEPTLVSEPVPVTETHFGNEPRRLGHYAFVVMCVVGMTVVWLYSSGRDMLNPSVLTGIVSKTGVQTVFANLVQTGIVSAFALFAALWIAVRRRASRLRLEA